MITRVYLAQLCCSRPPRRFFSAPPDDAAVGFGGIGACLLIIVLTRLAISDMSMTASLPPAHFQLFKYQ